MSSYAIAALNSCGCGVVGRQSPYLVVLERLKAVKLESGTRKDHRETVVLTSYQLDIPPYIHLSSILIPLMDYLLVNFSLSSSAVE